MNIFGILRWWRSLGIYGEKTKLVRLDPNMSIHQEDRSQRIPRPSQGRTIRGNISQDRVFKPQRQTSAERKRPERDRAAALEAEKQEWKELARKKKRIEIWRLFQWPQDPCQRGVWTTSRNPAA